VRKVDDRNKFKVFKENMQKAQGRKKPEEDLKSLKEWQEEYEKRWVENKNKDLTFTPKLTDKIYSIEKKAMVPRPKSTGRMGPDIVDRF